MADLQERIARLEAELKARIERADGVDVDAEGYSRPIVAMCTEHLQAHRALLETVYRLQILLYSDPAVESVACVIVGLIEHELGVTK